MHLQYQGGRLRRDKETSDDDVYQPGFFEPTLASYVCFSQILAWLLAGETVLMRISSDVAFVDNLIWLAYVFLFYATRSVGGAIIKIKNDCGEAHFCSFAKVVANVVALNPGPLMKYYKEHYSGRDKRRAESHAFLLRSLICDIAFGKLPFHSADETSFKASLVEMIRVTNALLGEWVVADPADSTNTKHIFVPLSEDVAKQVRSSAGGTRPPDGKTAAEHKANFRDFCDVCGSTKNLKRCSRCLVGRFCSSDCQKDGFEEHRKVCFDGKTVREMGPATELLVPWGRSPN